MFRCVLLCISEPYENFKGDICFLVTKCHAQIELALQHSSLVAKQSKVFDFAQRKKKSNFDTFSSPDFVNWERNEYKFAE